MKFTHFKSQHVLLMAGMILIMITGGIFLSCASEEPVITDDMIEEDYFQRAQEASDHENYKLALKYYYQFKERYPDNLEKNTWASYEIAFLYHKTGDDAKSIELLNELLALFAQDKTGVLPKAVKVLAETVKQKIQEKSTPPPVDTSSTTKQ
ncbi:MAG: hypothetical protein JW904_03150 [Spirochaetales bacterium]|nr:hypothetical protein [Spirochaetales bacterium]